jgi:hypothetical protein
MRTRIHNAIIAVACRILLAAAVAGPAAAVSAQQRARDFDPATAAAHRAMRQAQGPITFEGSQFLDYSTAISQSADLSRLPELLRHLPGGEEPEELMDPCYSRGHQVEMNWEFLDSLRDGVPSRARVLLFDGQEQELFFLHSEYRGPTQYTWWGHLAGVAAAHFIFVRENSAVRMSLVNYQDDIHYELRFAAAADHLPGRVRLLKIGDIRAEAGGISKRSPELPPSDSHAGTVPGAGGQPVLPPTGGGGGEFGPRENGSDPALGPIDVHFIATGPAWNAFGNSIDVFVSEISLWIADFHMRTDNSGISPGALMRLRIAHVEFESGAGWPEPFLNSVDRQGLNAWREYANRPELIAARNDSAADVVIVVRLTAWDSGFYGNPREMNMATPRGRFTLSSGEEGAAVGLIGLANTFDTPVRYEDAGTRFSYIMGGIMGGCHWIDVGCGTNPNCQGYPDSSDLPLTARHPEPTRVPLAGVDDCGPCWNRWKTTLRGDIERVCIAYDPQVLPFYSTPNITIVSEGCSMRIGDGCHNVVGMLNHSRSFVTQYRIGSTRNWAAPTTRWNIQNGRQFTPYTSIQTAVQTVSGGEDKAVVRANGGQYNATAGNNNQPVTLSNPCIIEKVGTAHVLIR